MAIKDLGNVKNEADPRSEIRRFNTIPPKTDCQCDCGCDCCENAGNMSSVGVQFGSGLAQFTASGLAANGFGANWGHDPVYINRPAFAEDRGSGFNWLVPQWPFLANSQRESLGVHDMVLVRGWQDSVWFKGTLNQSHSCFDYDPSDCGEDLEHKITPQILSMRRPNGETLTFHSFNQDSSPWGLLESLTLPGGQTISVQSYDGDYIEEIQSSYTVGSDTITRSIFNTYGSGLQTAVLRSKVNTGSWEDIRRIQCAYYGSAESHGSEGDLKTLKTQAPDGQGGWTTTGTYYFRYYKDGDANGFAHGLKYALDPEAYKRLDDAVADPLTASNAQVADYATRYFEYDIAHRVTKAKTEAGAMTHSFDYVYSGHADAANNWKFKTTETLPNGSEMIVYTNFKGQVLLKEHKDGSNSWVDYFTYNDDYKMTLHASPSAVTSYDDSQADLGVTLKSSDGYIRVNDYYTSTGSGGVNGELQYEKIKKGSSGTEIKLKKFEYATRTVDGYSIHPVSKETVYRNDDGTGPIDTSYSYSWHSGTFQMEERVTTLPAIPTGQNGSGSSNTRIERFDSHGNLIWLKDERGFIFRNFYDIVTGALTQQIGDVDTTQTTDEPSGWSTPSGGGLHVVTDYEHDDLGRITQVLGPAHEVDISGTATNVRTATWTVYDDENHEVRTAMGYATGAQWDTFTLVNPVSITKMDEQGRVVEEIKATRASTSGKLSASDTFAQSSYVRWTTHSYSDDGDLEHTRVYHTIPASGAGSSGTNYDQTDFGYDASGNQNMTKSPGGTITRTVFDVRGNDEMIYVGTDDTGATDSDPTGGSAQGNNMVVVTAYEYDGGNDGGDGNLTEVTQHVDSSTTRVTSYMFDWRNRQFDIDGEEDFFQRVTYDNLDRVTRVDRHDSTSGGNLVARSDTNFDDLGRVYQTVRYAVDPSTGTVGNKLSDNVWFDAAGNIVKQHPAGSKEFTKTSFDGLGRVTKQFVGFDVDETAYADADDVTGDTIFEQTEMDYDDASNVIQSSLRKRLHDATGTGELTTPSGSQPKARVYYVAHYPDAIGRDVATANYGDNGGPSFTRSSTIPTASDTILVTSTKFNDDGEAFKTVDPTGKEDRAEFDDAGRITKTIENYDDGDPTTGAADKDRTVECTYTADGLRKTIKAKQSSASDDQVTTYVYGTTLSDSAIARSDLLRAEIYPDSDDVADPLGNGADTIYDRIEYKYNRQGERTEMKDQNATVHAYDYDKLGRQTHDRIATLGSGVDGAVRRISTTYEVRGLREKTTSYDNATVGSGTVINEVLAEYSDLGMLVKEYQEHSGAKDANTPYVGYNYDATATSGEFTKGLRLKSIRYPNGRLVHHTYGSSGSDADNLNRLDAINDDSSGSPGAAVAEFTYLGLNQVVIEDYPEPDVKLDLFGGTSGSYAGLDRFDRIIDHRWYDYGSSTDVDRFKYGYDRASNRTWTENVVAASNSKDFDEFYTYDGLHRLKNFDRGDLTGNPPTGISGTPGKEEDWTLDPLGNWTGYVQKTAGTTDLDQSRTPNKVNEITDIDKTTGASWATPAYDKNGNMTTVPKPDDLANGFTCTYDSWNRMVKIEDGANTVAEYQYDGRNFRTLKDVYVSGSLDHTRHFYYTDDWQTLEERIDSSTDAERQFVWGSQYVDHLIIRERDSSSPADGVLNERLYALRDANWSVTVLTDIHGDITERFGYDPNGFAKVYSPMFADLATTSVDWDIRYSGYRLDVETGLYHVRNRMYLPNLGWLGRDAIGISATNLNLYEYCRSNALTFADADGYYAVPIICAGICIGCGFCVGFGVQPCLQSGDFWACYRRYVRAMPIWAQGICGGSCIGCVICIIRYLRPRCPIPAIPRIPLPRLPRLPRFPRRPPKPPRRGGPGRGGLGRGRNPRGGPSKKPNQPPKKPPTKKPPKRKYPRRNPCKSAESQTSRLWCMSQTCNTPVGAIGCLWFEAALRRGCACLAEPEAIPPIGLM